ncbi:hypothetical protein [Bacillus cereus]|uniref:hypothetical protein n=1 Tax=Bacillus cereus TaxID=1396 RepID=UPI002ABF1FB7|nr:hypothetical protein [Bacillus cereus]MDZ4567230.1 hypothetical protein [Bacillus cereus]
MKYSNGFFIFKATPLQSPSKNELNFKFEMWMFKKTINNYDCYDYTWIISDSWGYKQELHHAPVWIDQDKDFVIIFLQNEKLLPEVISSIGAKFHLFCEPFPIKINRISHNDDTITSRINLFDVVNKVKTNLLRNDSERLSIIQTVLTGG